MQRQAQVRGQTSTRKIHWAVQHCRPTSRPMHPPPCPEPWHATATNLSAGAASPTPTSRRTRPHSPSRGAAQRQWRQVRERTSVCMARSCFVEAYTHSTIACSRSTLAFRGALTALCQKNQPGSPHHEAAADMPNCCLPHSQQRFLFTEPC